MKMLLNKWGLEQVPYLAELIDVSWRVLLVLLLSWVAWHVCARLIAVARLRLLVRATAAEEQKRVHTMTQVFRYAVGVLLTVVTAMLVLGELGISIAPLLATAGVAGIAIGFGVQSLVKDYFAGFALLVENQVRQGDVIEAAGKSGLVEEVTLRYIRLRDYEGVVHFIPNGLVSTVSNRSLGFACAVIEVGIAYHCDVGQALAVMGQTAAELRADPRFAAEILDDLDIAGLDKLADSAVMLKARLKTAPLKQDYVRREYLKRLKEAFDAQGIEIPFPHLTVYPGTAPSRAGFRVELPAPSARAG